MLNNPPNNIPLFVDSSPPVSGSSVFLGCDDLAGVTALTFSLISMTGVTTLPCSIGLEGFLGSSFAGGTGLPGSVGTSGVGGVGVSGSRYFRCRWRCIFFNRLLTFVLTAYLWKCRFCLLYTSDAADE